MIAILFSFAKFFFVLTALAGSQPQAAAHQWSMGFWDSGAPQFNGIVPITSLDFSKLTHLAQVTAMVNPDGTLTFNCAGVGPCSEEQMEPEIRSVVSAAHAANIKVLMSVATRRDGVVGWESASTPENLAAFVANIVAVVDKYGYDGVDIDWEHTPVQRQTADLISALRAALGKKILTADALVWDGAFWAGAAKDLDRVNVMTYDLAGCHSWEVMWFNSPVYSDPDQRNWSLDVARQRMVSAGIPPEKLNLGIPFYGYAYSGTGGPRSGIAPACRGAEADYNKIIATRNVSAASRDAVTGAPWLPLEDGYLTFDNPDSVAAHTSYIQDHRLGGWVVWKLQGDYVPAAAPSHPLLAALPVRAPCTLYKIMFDAKPPRLEVQVSRQCQDMGDLTSNPRAIPAETVFRLALPSAESIRSWLL